jgi:hypothetical protein
MRVSPHGFGGDSATIIRRLSCGRTIHQDGELQTLER